jgi:tetratricopeptide (TPR) repeat protein
MAEREGPFSKPSLVRTLTLMIVGIVVMFAADVFLAKVEQQESHVEAARFYDQGQRLLVEGRSAEAAEQFRSALAVERNNQDYQLALGQAQLAAGELPAAASTLNNLLASSPFSGPANLAMARARVRQDDIDEAVSLYHRAIYGQWKDNSVSNQVQVRFELVDLLDRQNRKQDLLAELLPLQEEAPDNLETRTKLGHLFLDAGSPARALDVFHAILHDAPSDADAHAGLGEAEFSQGNYRAADREFREAVRLNPGDQQTRSRLVLCDQVLDLDPSRRGLGAEEQYNRSRKLVSAVLDDVRQCLGASAPADAQNLIDMVTDGLNQRVSPARRGDAMEDELDWADELWAIRKSDCKQPLNDSEQPLALVLKMLAR